jgi:hypothetical protein
MQAARAAVEIEVGFGQSVADVACCDSELETVPSVGTAL